MIKNSIMENGNDVAQIRKNAHYWSEHGIYELYQINLVAIDQRTVPLLPTFWARRNAITRTGSMKTISSLLEQSEQLSRRNRSHAQHKSIKT